jgi:hypothetical protein
MKRFTKQWKVLWNGHQLVVNNWWDCLLRGGEELLIDGKIVDHHESWLKFSRDLEAKLITEGEEHQVRIHVGSIDFGFRVGCKIFVDDQPVGGDIHKRFIT